MKHISTIIIITLALIIVGLSIKATLQLGIVFPLGMVGAIYLISKLMDRGAIGEEL